MASRLSVSEPPAKDDLLAAFRGRRRKAHPAKLRAADPLDFAPRTRTIFLASLPEVAYIEPGTLIDS
jgi:hypothetical protein